MDKEIKAENVSYDIAGASLLNNVSINLMPGFMTAIAGPNGSGKTTALRLLSGDLKTTSGIVKFHGRGIEQWPVSELAKLRAVLPQQSRLDFSFTVEQVVAMGREPFITDDISSADGIKIVDEAIKVCHIESLRHRIYTDLSGGEKQRVQIARVLTQIWPEPQVPGKFIFLDEPVNQLDIRHQHIIMKLLQELKHKGIGVCIVLHDLRLIKLYTDRVILLNQGQLIATGSFDEVIHADSLRKNFGVMPEQAGLL